ncbi:MAG: iron-siderophore ABC transporter substrate-binding protein [Cyanobacteria bacterium P01_H01_bin.21]
MLLLPKKKSSWSFWCLATLGLLISISLSNCDGSAEQNLASSEPVADECRIIEHANGSSCIPTLPQRVVTLDMDSLANMLAMNTKPIAASSGWDIVEPFPQHLQALTDGVEYVGSTSQPNLEKILTLKPDLIIANQYLDPFYEQLSQIAPTVTLNNKEPWQKMLSDLGKVIEKEDTATQLIDKYEQRVEQLQKALDGAQDTLQVSMATVQNDNGIYTYGPNYFASSVLADIGLQRPPSQTGDFIYKDVSLESLSDIDGNVLIFVTWPDESDQEAFGKLRESPLWQQLDAVKNEKVFRVSAGHWYVDESVLAVNAILDDLFEHLVTVN